MPASLLLLAGGEGRRMGRPKETLPWRGSTVIEVLVERLRPGFAEVLIATGNPDRLPSAVRSLAIRDSRFGHGPLAGLEAGLDTARHPSLVAVACDLPHVSLGLAGALLDRLRGGRDAVVPFVGPRPDVLCAAYSRSALPAVRRVLDSSEGASRRPPVASLLEGLRVRYVGLLEFRLEGLEERALWNLNTLEDYQVLLTGR